MGFLVGFFLMILSLFRYLQDKVIAKPEVIFCLEWSIISILASFGFFGLYSVSSETWFIILIGSSCFISGSIFVQGGAAKQTDILKFNCVNENKEKRNRKIFWILFFFLCVYQLSTILACIALLKKGYSLSAIRDISYGYYSVAGFSVQQNVNLTPFIGALATFNTALGIFIFMSNMKRNKLIIVSVFLFMIIQFVTNGGRFNLVYTFLELVVCFSLLKYKGKNLNFSDQNKRTLKRIILVLVLLLFITTSLRDIDSNDMLKHFYMYLSGDVVLLDVQLERIKSLGVCSMGFGSFYGFWGLLFPLLRLLFDIQLPELWNQTLSYVITAQESFNVGSSMKMNAFVTPYYYLYADMGIFGVIFGMFLFGLFAGLMYRTAIYSDSEFDMVNYLIVCQMIFKTLQLYPTVSGIYVLLICYFIFSSIIRKIILHSSK